MDSSALSGLTVLDLGQAFMGPYCGLLMQRLGADVIKVEPPGGEPYRRPTARKGVEAVQFGLLNAGKRSLCIDLKSPDGRNVFSELAAKADVVIQNFAPGVFDRLVGIDALCAANPRLIVASGSGYGSSGPLKDVKAMDLTIQAMAGVMATTGFESSPPVRTGPAVVDFMGGTHLFGAVMAALVQRGTTGRGQKVEVALYDSMIPSLASNIGGYFDSDGSIPERTGNRHGGLLVAPYNAYRCADGWVAVLCLHDRHWSALCTAMDRSDLITDTRYASNASRVAHLDEVDDIIDGWTTRFDTVTIVSRLNRASVPSAPVVDLPGVLNSPQVADRGMFNHHENDEREWWTFGSPLRLSDSPAVGENVPPLLGEHTRDVLAEKLGLADDAIGALLDSGVAVAEQARASVPAGSPSTSTPNGRAS